MDFVVRWVARRDPPICFDLLPYSQLKAAYMIERPTERPMSPQNLSLDTQKTLPPFSAMFAGGPRVVICAMA